ncbi:hypothetical protein QAD02_022202 [Eretmocerus hayati]|uniref:Uncharacterized protein n=1 Tax=Eretmocerus hayati TaxID=131215 RepID=A0ACC2PSE6_9HYME|nr:hypothetical protein QAD02_022202 [Eretmocerus hayati]
MTIVDGSKADFGNGVQRLNTGLDENILAYGFRRSWVRTFFTYTAYILTVGILRLFFHWYPYLHLYATHRRCSLKDASKILIIDDYQGRYKTYFVKDVKIVAPHIPRPTGYTSIEIEETDVLGKLRGKNLKISLENGTKIEVPEYRAFWCKKKCYVWDVMKFEFSKLIGLDKYTYCSDLNAKKNHGLSKEEQTLQRTVYGTNEIIVPVQSVGVLLILEILNPFYIFQIFTLAVWLPEGYVYYSFAILCMSIFGITSSILQTRKNQISLRNTVASTEGVRVLRDSGELENISSAELVPGDIIELPRHKGMIVCDAVLLNGVCVVNESMLTGESVPVTKTSLQPRPVLYDSRECSQHTLFCGTTIIQTKSNGDKPVLARVIKTGLQTNKGSLVTAILYPPPVDFKFDQDSYKFILILSVIALCGFIYTVISKMEKGMPYLRIAAKALDLITIVVPPALPAVMTVGKLYAQARLKKQQIYCINTRAINVSGSINCICFDKTGTLTEDGLDMMGVVVKKDHSLMEPERSVSKLKDHLIFEGMLVCHSLTIIDDELSGDPLDVKMFESTGWQLELPEVCDSSEFGLQPMSVIKPPRTERRKSSGTTEIEILQQYQFSSTLQRMSVIMKIRGLNELRAYTKGSPEMILGLSRPESIPSDVSVTLHRYTEQGYRVIAVGYSRIDADLSQLQSLSRDDVERDIEFLGLIILENRLKVPTINVIKELRAANMKTIMITGDNIQTAVSVAKECGIISHVDVVVNVTVVPVTNKSKPDLIFHAQNSYLEQSVQRSVNTIESIEHGLSLPDYKFALTGTTWRLLREHYYDILPRICIRGAVFARMTSDQKQQLVVELMQLGYYVAMCGDGANDCGALRAAHVGISLSEAESSVASPFTSQLADIRCVPMVIKQGRAALVTSFGIFKFMINYSLTEFASTIILYTIDANLTDLEFLFIDLCLAVNLAFFFGKTEASQGQLVPRPPTTSILGFTTLFSLAGHMFLIVTFQLVGFYLVQHQSWFEPFIPPPPTDPEDSESYSCYENYTVFAISIFQYIILAVVFSRGEPYRRALYSNLGFVMSILVTLCLCIYVTVWPAVWVASLLKLKMPPVLNWRLVVLGLAGANLVASLVLERLIVEWAMERKLKPKLYRPDKSSKPHQRLEHQLRELEAAREWPKLSDEQPILPISPSALQVLNTSGSEQVVTENKKPSGDNGNSRGRLGDLQQGLDNPAFEDDGC